MIELIAHTTQTLTVTVYTDETNTTPLDLSSGVDEIYFTLKPEFARRDADDAQALFQKKLTTAGVSVADGANGILNVFLLDTDYATYSDRLTYWADLKIDFTSGAKRVALIDRCDISLPITRT